jgi:integrase
MQRSTLTLFIMKGPSLINGPISSPSSIDTALVRACSLKRANLPALSLYSFRHLGTSVLRRARVPKEQIDYQLGHRQGGARSTQDYGQYEANYLQEASEALNAWIARVLALAAKSHGNPTKRGKSKARAV